MKRSDAWTRAWSPDSTASTPSRSRSTRYVALSRHHYLSARSKSPTVKTRSKIGRVGRSGVRVEQANTVCVRQLRRESCTYKSFSLLCSPRGTRRGCAPRPLVAFSGLAPSVPFVFMTPRDRPDDDPSRLRLSARGRGTGIGIRIYILRVIVAHCIYIDRGACAARLGRRFTCSSTGSCEDSKSDPVFCAKHHAALCTRSALGRAPLT